MVCAYITNAAGAVSVIDLSSNTVTDVITLPSGAEPKGTAFSPDGSLLYVADNSDALHCIYVINTSSNTVIDTITFPLETNPFCLAITPDGSHLYSTNGDTSSNGFSVVNLSTYVITYITDSSLTLPSVVALTPNGALAFITNGDTDPGVVSILNTSTNEVIATASVGDGVNGVATSPDGLHAYVTCYYGTAVGSVYRINTAYPYSVSGPISVAPQPWAIAFTPDSKYAYIACLDETNGSKVSIINTATSAVSTITLPSPSTNYGAESIAITHDGQYAYVVNEDTVSILATSTNTWVSDIDLSYGGGGENFGNFIQPPVATDAYIPQSGLGTLAVLNLATYMTSSTITVGSDPNGVALSPDGSRVYVANYSSANVSVICTTTNAVIATLTVESNPFGVAISPNGNNIYVANKGDNSLSVINASNFAVTTIRTGIGTQPTGVAVSPDNSTVYVTNYGSGNVSVLSAGTGTLIATVSVGTNPYGIVLSPDGTLAYVANQGSTSLSVINTSTYVATPITAGVGSEPTALALNPAGTILYVSNYSAGTVSSFNAATYAHIEDITVGTNPFGMSFSSDGNTLYVINYGSNNITIIDVTTGTVITTIPLSSGSSAAAFGQFIQPASTPMTTVYVPPQGRLTLTSNTPVMTADATAQTSVYYTPYQGNIVPIYNGANMVSYTFSQLTMALNTSNQTSGNIYDLFVFLNSGIVTVGAGPAWSSATPGSSSRGTGAGTTQLQQIDGLWVNENAITLKNGTTTYSSVPAGEATYVGTVYMTANGQTAMQFKPAPTAGGSDNVLGIWNAYNRVKINSICRDSNTSWTYASGTWRSADNSNNNRVSWIDGLQQTYLRARYEVLCATNTNATGGLIGIGLNNTSSPDLWGVNTQNIGQNNIIEVEETFPPQLGVNYLQAVETISGASNITYYGEGVWQSLIVEMEN